VAVDGRVVWTGRLAAGVVPDRWANFEVVQPHAGGDLGAEAAGTQAAVGGMKRTLIWSAGGAAVASGAVFALAHSSRARFDDPATPVGELEALRGQTNTRVVVSGGLGAVALGLGTAGLLFSVNF
jgi:hypothetical protein